MKYHYWILLGIVLFIMCYALANPEAIIVEMMDSTAVDPSVTSGPMSSETGPVPATQASTTEPTAAPAPTPDVQALATQVATLQKKIDDLSTSTAAQVSQATAAQASLNAVATPANIA